MENITASVDIALLQEKANEFATKGALKAIEDYYTSYNSPYKKAIEESLSNVSLDSFGLKLPDILGLINDSLTTEIDAIANTAIAKTFVPLVQKFLTRQEKLANFSAILKEFIETCNDPDKYMDDFSVDVDRSIQYGWLSITIEDSKRKYTFTLHENNESKKTANIKYNLLSLPYTDKTEKSIMKVSIDGATLELPFTRDILRDSFVSYLAGYIISDTIITMDTREFDEDMFPENCHCH
jgi:hypothetical protein